MLMTKPVVLRVTEVQHFLSESFSLAAATLNQMRYQIASVYLEYCRTLLLRTSRETYNKHRVARPLILHD